MALTTRQRNIHNKNNSKRSSFNKGKRKASDGDIIVTSAPSDLRKIWYPGGALALTLLITARLLSVFFVHISDCDETYNYWEPLHYLIYGNGLQTWEYSPEYAIRSYAFLWVFGIPGKQLSFIFEPATVFYMLKAMIAIMTAIVELGFYKAVCHEFGVHIGRIWLACSLTAAGTNIISVSILPSAVGAGLAAAALASCWRRRHAAAVALTACNALLGWPFTAIIGLPIAIDMIVLKQQYSDFVRHCLTSLMTYLIPTVIVDSWYYGKLVIAPWNIVAYNIFTEHGPSLYGVEPWTYYFVNGFLNFNIVWVASLLCPAALLWCHAVAPRSTGRSTFCLPYWLDLLPLYLWLAIFFIQPHKEERFLYPVYSMIILAGAITLDCVQKIVYTAGVGIFRVRDQSVKHYLNYTMPLVILFTAVTAILGLSRLAALHTNYGATSHIFQALPPLESGSATVCFGKDWYRSPSSFLLPHGYRMRFIMSEFDGQMPAPYAETSNATRLIQPHFNDKNKADPRTYLKPSQCHYLVDSDIGQPSTLEPSYYRDTSVWELISHLPLLNPDRSHKFYRAFYVPILSERYTVFGSLYLLKNRFI